MKCSTSGNVVFHFVMLLPIVTVQTNKLNTLEGRGSSNACQMLTSTENQLRFNGFSLREKKTSAGENKAAIHHNNHQEGPCLPTEASATTAALGTLCSIRATGTRPHPPTSSITYASPTRLYFLRTTTNN